MIDLESKTIFILREAYKGVQPLAMLWSMGKDSTALLWMVRKSFFGKVPFPVVLLDTGMELPEVYEFRDRLIKEWKLDCISYPCPPEEEMDQSLPPATRAAMRKPDGSWDFKGQPPELWGQFQTEVPEGSHLRIHPILHWSELDIWRYTKEQNIPCVPLYFSRDGKRYRSLGEKNITFPVTSNASNIDEIIAELGTTKISERSGRSMDNETEDSFEKLRARGYM